MKALKINHKLSFVTSFFLFLTFVPPIAMADITTTGETSPAYDSSDPWTITGDLIVGNTLDGTVTISSASEVNNINGFIGYDSSSTGNVSVKDNGSLWENSSLLYIGYNGNGELNVSNGGEVRYSEIVIGSETNSQGIVLVTGNNSLCEGSESMLIGNHGEAELTIADGGVVRGKLCNIGYWSTSTGHVIVSGENSGLYLDSLNIGQFGAGYLTISNGGTVATNYNTIIGRNSGGYGIVTVTNSGSLLDCSGGLYVSLLDGGQGELIISNGGTVICSYAHFDGIESSTGNVTITGTDSYLNNLGYLVVGYNYEANLFVSNGGKVTTVGGYLGFQTGSLGTVSITGANSLWEDSDIICIGGTKTESRGSGLLNVSNDGLVSANNILIWNTGEITGNSVLQANTVTNKGTIRPGNSIGTLTIDGDLIMQADSTLEIEVDNSGNNDKLVVTGDTTIEGGAVHAISTETITNEQEYTILETVSRTGTFDSLSTSMLSAALLDSELSYETGLVKLILSPLSFDDSSIVSSDNQKSVGSALQVIADDGGNSITTGLQQLTDLSDVRNAYDQLSGQTYASLALVTTSSNTHFTDTVSGRLHNTHSGVSSGFNDSILFAMAQPDKNTSMYDTDTSMNSIALGNGTNYYAKENWGLWLRGYGVFGDREAQSDSPGYQYRTYGTGFGMDYKFSDELILGVTGGYSGGNVDYFSSRDESNITSTPIGLYGSWFTESVYIDSIINYTPMEYETKRYVDLTSEILKGDFDGSETSAYIEAGQNWFYDKDSLIQPMASFQFSYLNLDSYTESGGVSALSFDEHSYKSYKGSLGMKANKQFRNDTKDQSLTIELRGRWSHEFGDTKSNINANFASNPSAIFKISDEGLPRDSAIFGIGLRQLEKQNMMYYIDYDASLNKEDTSHIISAGIRYRW